jgi:RNA polymerase sigma-70 factor (ECF subfamily)
MKAWANLARYEAGTNLRAWLFTILRNTFYSEHRKHRLEIEDADGHLAAGLSTPARQNDHMDFEDFRVALQQLAPDQREALILVGASGLSYEEAAEICGCAVGTIKSRVNRARGRLGELLGLASAEEALAHPRARGRRVDIEEPDGAKTATSRSA